MYLRVGASCFCLLRLFCVWCAKIRKDSRTWGNEVKPKELRDLADALRESALHRTETARIMHVSMGELTRELQSTQKLWRKGCNSVLIKVGLALIAFPDPTITDIIGSALVAAGLIQTKVKRSALHIEDVYKTFPMVIKELGSVKQSRIQQ